MGRRWALAQYYQALDGQHRGERQTPSTVSPGVRLTLVRAHCALPFWHPEAKELARDEPLHCCPGTLVHHLMQNYDVAASAKPIGLPLSHDRLFRSALDALEVHAQFNKARYFRFLQPVALPEAVPMIAR